MDTLSIRLLAEAVNKVVPSLSKTVISTLEGNTIKIVSNESPGISVEFTQAQIEIRSMSEGNKLLLMLSNTLFDIANPGAKPLGFIEHAFNQAGLITGFVLIAIMGVLSLVDPAFDPEAALDGLEDSIEDTLDRSPKQ